MNKKRKVEILLMNSLIKNCHHFQPDVLIDAINVSITITNEKQFYGLYNQGLPQRCWSSDSRYLFLSTAQRANVKSYIVNIGK